MTNNNSNQIENNINPQPTEAFDTIALLGYDGLSDALHNYLTDKNIPKIKAVIEKTVLSLIRNDVLDPSCTARSLRWTGRLVLVGIEIHRFLKALDAELASYFLKTIQASVRNLWHESQYRTLQDAIADGKLPHYTLVPPEETDVWVCSPITPAKRHQLSTRHCVAGGQGELP